MPKLAKSIEPDVPPKSTNIASRNAVPRCVATRYVQPARTTLSSSCSNVTRKNEASDMISHATRNRTAFPAVTTRTMLATSALKKNQGGPSDLSFR